MIFIDMSQTFFPLLEFCPIFSQLLPFVDDSVNTSNVFFPAHVQGARIGGWELTLHSSRIRNRAQLYLTYSNPLVLGLGCIVGGLTGDCPVPPPGDFFLDHDQRDTLHFG